METYISISCVDCDAKKKEVSKCRTKIVNIPRQQKEKLQVQRKEENKKKECLQWKQTVNRKIKRKKADDKINMTYDNLKIKEQLAEKSVRVLQQKNGRKLTNITACHIFDIPNNYLLKH